MKKKILVLFILVVILSYGCGQITTAEKPETSPQTKSQESWTFETQELMTGEKVTESIIQESSLTMVNFWGTFCQPCIREMPDLGDLARENQSKDFKIIGVMVDVVEEDEKADQARFIVQQTHADYPHLYVTESLLDGVQNIQAVPTTIFFDREGRVVGKPILGVKSKAEYQKTIDAYLSEVAQ